MLLAQSVCQTVSVCKITQKVMNQFLIKYFEGEDVGSKNS